MSFLVSLSACTFGTCSRANNPTKLLSIANRKKRWRNCRSFVKSPCPNRWPKGTRPAKLDDIVGQEEGLRALRAALCGPNPQHVIIYGPPGVGKTAAARVVLEEARKNPFSPFKHDAKFVELDATTARFDERGIADPLIGSVHDPIYQGAGAMGVAGIPQPKQGAVTKAHGGLLFIDEIGELHPIQMNKMLKVLEDRKVFLELAYYSPEDRTSPVTFTTFFKTACRPIFAWLAQRHAPPRKYRRRFVPVVLKYFFERCFLKRLSRLRGKPLRNYKFGTARGR